MNKLLLSLLIVSITLGNLSFGGVMLSASDNNFGSKAEHHAMQSMMLSRRWQTMTAVTKIISPKPAKVNAAIVAWSVLMACQVARTC